MQLLVLSICVLIATDVRSQDAIDRQALTAPRKIAEWGESGDQPGQFHSPIGIAIDEAQRVIITDLNNARVQWFSTNGVFEGEFNLPRDTPDRRSCMIGGIAVIGENLIVLTFMVQHKVSVYRLDGTCVQEWGTKGSQLGEWNQPGGIVVLPDRKLAIADQCNHRIQIMSFEGQPLQSWGAYGAALGSFGAPEPAGSRFGGPHMIGVNAHGNLFTSEAAAGRIQHWLPSGEAIAQWGKNDDAIGGFGDYRFANLTNGLGPIGVFVDDRDRVWVTSLNDRVQCFDTDGHFLMSLDDPESSFSHPHGMAIDRAGYLYVVDSGNQRIVKFATPAP